MSLTRKSSSTDEFYDAVESMEEIPSSSREESASQEYDWRGSSALPSHSLEENDDDDDEVNFDRIDNSDHESDDIHSSTKHLNGASRLKRHSSESDENWASARCLLDNNDSSRHLHLDNNASCDENGTSRCIVEPVPSLMDVVSESVSQEEERGNGSGLLQSESREVTEENCLDSNSYQSPNRNLLKDEESNSDQSLEQLNRGPEENDRPRESCDDLDDTPEPNLLNDKISSSDQSPGQSHEDQVESSDIVSEISQETCSHQSTEQHCREQITKAIESATEKDLDVNEQDKFVTKSHNLDFEHIEDENHESMLDECCTGMDQINFSQHDQETNSLSHDDATNHQLPKHSKSETEQDYIDHSDSFIANNEEANSIILNTQDIFPSCSKDDSSCFDRESANGFLPVDVDSISTSHAAGPLTPTRRDEDENATDKSIANIQFSTPLHQSTKRVTDDCSVLDYCDLTSPLEALYLLCSRGSMLKKESMEELLLNDVTDATSPERYSCSNDVDPKVAAPLSPAEDRDVRPDSDSDDDSASATSFSSLNKFRIVDRDTGKVFDVREVMKDIDEAGESTAFDTRYSFLPSKRELQRRTVTNESSMEIGDNADEESFSIGPLGTESFDTMSSISYRDSPGATGKSGSGTTRKKTKLSDLKSSIAHKLHKSSLSRKRTASSDTIPRNAIHVKSTSRQHGAPIRNASSVDLRGQQGSSSFNPMLLVKTIPKSHDGPAWCASFSLDGRFLATAGEDGNVCIWAVSPRSSALHPDNIGNSQTNEMMAECYTPKEEAKEKSNSVEIDSPITLDSNELDNEKVAVDTVPEDVPPLNFVGTGPELATNLDILSNEPLQRFKDHTADVIDLSWSHTNFLLTASLDSSVRLYHYSKSHCLHLFKHASLVASVAFHPNDERYFISGGIDKKLRLWNITDGRVKDWAQAPDVITAVRFTPDGKYAVAGLFRGQVYFYDSDGLKYCKFNSSSCYILTFSGSYVFFLQTHK